MFIIAVTTIKAIAGLYVLYIALTALNKMDGATHIMVRCAHIALACGSSAGVLACLVDRYAFDCVYYVGTALYLGWNRRALPVGEVSNEH